MTPSEQTIVFKQENVFKQKTVPKQFKRDIKISGTGLCVGDTKVSDFDLDDELSLPQGSVFKKTGVKFRYRQSDRNTPKMGAEAIKNAIKEANWELSDIDAIISTSSSGYTLIPCNAIRIQKELDLGNSGISCFEINATCLGFIMAFDLAALKISCGLWNKVVIVSSESCHFHLNKKNLESYGLFGDGAVAVCMEKSNANTYLAASSFESFGDHLELCTLKGGSVYLPAHKFATNNEDDYYFAMNGPQVFKQSAIMLKDFCARTFESITHDNQNLQKGFEDIDIVIPHQASVGAMELIRRRLNIPEDKWFSIIENYGNCISASVPMALHVARSEGKLSSGKNVFLLGTGAGLSLGAIILRT